MYRIKAAIADLWGLVGAWKEARLGHEAILAVKPSFSVSLVGQAAAAAALEDYQAVGVAVETAVQHGLRLSAAPSRIKVIYGSALLELARGMLDVSAAFGPRFLASYRPQVSILIETCRWARKRHGEQRSPFCKRL